MTINTSKLVSVERVEKIIECYGANSQFWPMEERTAAMALVAGSDDLQQKLNEARQLDDVIVKSLLVSSPDDNTLQDSNLAMRIMDNLPEQELSSSYSGKKGHHNQWVSIGAGALAASLMVAVGAFFAHHNPTGDPINTTIEISQSSELDQWFWDDVTVEMAQVVDEDPPVDSFISLLELES